VGQRSPWRDGIETLVMAVAMALFLKYFVVEAYKIPSGSMQPTLIGDDSSGIKDRILVDKLTYLLRAPRRWEVAVFRYPLDRSKSFVKRIAGVGPEDFRIANGDLWRRDDEAHDWQILRRPPGLMATTWKALDEERPLVSRWVPRDLPRSSQWHTEGRAIVAEGRGTAAFRGGQESIVDGYLDGYPESLLPWLPGNHRNSGNNPVGDLRLAGRVEAQAGTESLTLVLSEGSRSYRFELPGPAAAPGARARIEAGPWGRLLSDDALRAQADFRLPEGRALAFAAQNLDDRLTLEIDGEPLLALDVEPAEDQDSSVQIEIEGSGARLEQLMVYRDIYYTPGSEDWVRVPADAYFMLGDNTQDSSDSREWSLAVYTLKGEDAPEQQLRGNWRDGENPRSVGYGRPGGPLTYLVDEWGEPHWFPRSQATREASEARPFVPREMIQGRALAVFWPLDPRRGVWRLKWVH